ncbi:MAG: ParB/RepB/Spo0J family partition protein [Alphaproteobacteria bacterium]|nr:ParB/RepB/Spo0J family partition protein [Alphaproteobacteria bacterium]
MTQQAAKPSPLGRGLSALFGDADASYQPKPAAPVTPAAERGGAKTLPLTWLQPGAFQPRRHFDQEMLKGLAESIRERGILEPLLVRAAPGAQDAYEIIAGERRWRAAQMAGLHDVPVLVRNISDREALEIGLIENIQRQDLSPLEEAEGYQRLLGEFGHTQEALAKIVGKSRPHITNMLRLLTLPAPVKQMIDTGALTIGHARALITSKDPAGLAQEIVKKGLNVRQAEALAQRHTAKPQAKKKAEATGSADVTMLEKELERLVGLRVKIQTQGKAGSLTLFYKDLDQLDDIIKRLRG